MNGDSITAADILEIAEEWYKSKLYISILEKNIKIYKKTLNKYLDKNGVKTTSVGDYKLQRRDISRDFLLKKSVPDSVWINYSTKKTFPAFYISKKK